MTKMLKHQETQSVSTREVESEAGLNHSLWFSCSQQWTRWVVVGGRGVNRVCHLSCCSGPAGVWSARCRPHRCKNVLTRCRCVCTLHRTARTQLGGKSKKGHRHTGVMKMTQRRIVALWHISSTNKRPIMKITSGFSDAALIDKPLNKNVDVRKHKLNKYNLIKPSSSSSGLPARQFLILKSTHLLNLWSFLRGTEDQHSSCFLRKTHKLSTSQSSGLNVTESEQNEEILSFICLALQKKTTEVLF